VAENVRDFIAIINLIWVYAYKLLAEQKSRTIFLVNMSLLAEEKSRTIFLVNLLGIWFNIHEIQIKKDRQCFIFGRRA
jgi:hypothetical protein